MNNLKAKANYSYVKKIFVNIATYFKVIKIANEGANLLFVLLLKELILIDMILLINYNSIKKI